MANKRDLRDFVAWLNSQPLAEEYQHKNFDLKIVDRYLSEKQARMHAALGIKDATENEPAKSS